MSKKNLNVASFAHIGATPHRVALLTEEGKQLCQLNSALPQEEQKAKAKAQRIAIAMALNGAAYDEIRAFIQEFDFYSGKAGNGEARKAESVSQWIGDPLFLLANGKAGIERAELWAERFDALSGNFLKRHGIKR